MSELIGEVIAANTRMWTVEVHRDAPTPPFGAWVYVKQEEGTRMFGLISMVEVGSSEPNRQAVALGRTREELQREMPQVFELLRTTLQVQVLAYCDIDGRYRQTLPPYPADIHAFVFTATREDQQALLAPYDYLRTLLQQSDSGLPADDLLVAVLSNIQQAYDSEQARYDALLSAGRMLSRLLNDDHERLQSILRRVQPE